MSHQVPMNRYFIFEDQTQTSMSSVIFIFDIIFSCLITLIFLYRCGNYRKQHLITTLAVFISWFFSILFIFVLPLDISLAAYQDCLISKGNTSSNDTCPRPWSYVDLAVHKDLWDVVYWTSFILTWLILPLMQSFRETGEFSIKGKIKYTIKVNLIYYGTLLIIFGIIIIYLLADKILDKTNFMVTMTTASTTWGLFLLVLLLGYGLVEVPLNVYNHSRTTYMLSHTQFKLSRLFNEKVDVEDSLDTLIDELTKLCMQIKSDDPLRPYLEQVVKIVPEQYSDRIKLTVEDYENNRIVLTTRYTDTETEEKLVKLNERLKTDIHIQHRVQTYWTQMINEAFYFEDILNNEKKSDHLFLRQTPVTTSWLRQKLFNDHPKLEWYTYCLIRPWGLRLVGILLGAISIIVIWSEMTFFSTDVVLSIFALCVNAARNHYAYFTIEVICFLSMAYLCLCAYYTIFRIRIFNYFYLSLYHLTDETSLIFAATFLCRLTPPLCYNFLGMIHMDQAITHRNEQSETAFTTIMGHMNVIPMISRGFNFYFPMLICLLSIGTYFRLGSRCLHACGVRQFFDDNDLSAEYVEDGRSLMNRERRNYGGINTLSNTTTAQQRRDRRRELEQKYGLRSASAMASNNLHGRQTENSESRPLLSGGDEPLSNSNNQYSEPNRADNFVVGFTRRLFS